jgi:hypothetical protein
LIILVNVVRFFGGTVLPDELGDTYPVVSATNWDYTAAAALAGMFALIFQDPSVDEGSLASDEQERDGEPCRWFIPSGRPLIMLVTKRRWSTIPLKQIKSNKRFSETNIDNTFEIHYYLHTNYRQRGRFIIESEQATNDIRGIF